MGCVYKITNKINNKFYVGSTCNLNRRMREHFGDLKRGCHYSTDMQKDYDKYGRDSFSVIVLEECDDSIVKDVEQKYIDSLKAVDNGYNQARNSKANTLGTKHKESTIRKMQEKAKGSNNANATSVLQYDLEMNFIREWDCVADIGKYYGWASHTHVTNCCKRNIGRTGKLCTGKGFIWMYKDAPKRKRVV